MANITLAQTLHTDGNEPLSTTSKKLNVRASEIEALIGSLSDTAVTDPTAVASAIALLKGSLSKLQTVITEIDLLEENTDGIEALLTALNGYVDGLEAALTALNAKDFATQTTLAAVLAAVDGLEAKLDTLTAKDFATQTTLNAIKSVMDMSRKGVSTDTKPTTGVATNTTFWEMDTGNMYYYNGTSWVVMS